jgi:lysophospholipase L1-like esterase
LALCALLALPGVANSLPLTIAGFGDSITCTVCNDGSYLSLLDNYLAPAPIILDHGDSADPSSLVHSRLQTWLGDPNNTADVVVILTGTPDVYQAVGGFLNRPYSQAETLGYVDSMLDLVLNAGMEPLLAAPPPVQDPCGVPDVLTCGTIDGRLFDLSVEYALLASGLGVPFVDLYSIYSADPRFAIDPSQPGSLFRTDGLHPKFDTGDDLIAMSIADGILAVPIPEPSTGLLLAFGLAALAGLRSSPPMQRQ